MKLGCSSWSYHNAIRSGRMRIDDFIRICGEELEVDGVELVDLHFSSTEPEDLRVLKRRCVDLHLTLAGIAVSNDFGQHDRRDAERAAVQRWCDVAAYMGAPIVRVFAGWTPPAAPPRDEGRIVGFVRRVLGPGRVDARRTWSDIAETLRLCADYAGERGVTLALQNTRSDGIVASPLQLAQLVRDVGSPWLKICLDPADFADLTGVDAALRDTVQAHARVADLAEDGGDVRVAWPLLLQTMQLGHYRGFVLLDYEGVEPAETAVPKAVRYLRGILHLLSRQRMLAETHTAERHVDSPARFAHPDLTDSSVADAIAHVRSDAGVR